MTEQLYWVRAFRRETADDVLQVLMNGDTTHPDPNCTTQRHERILGIAPPRVYAYLGHACDEFGHSAYAIKQEGVEGEISPFDTGGVVNHHRPVCSQPDEQKAAFVEQYTWASSQRSEVFDHYPGTTPDSIVRYLRGERPVVAGPHVHWGGEVTSDIWQHSREWRSWAWELRVANRLAAEVSQVVAWSSTNVTHRHIVRAARRRKDVREWLLKVSGKYISGGVSAMHAELQRRQVA